MNEPMTEVNTLVRDLTIKIRATLSPDADSPIAATVLEWLAAQKPETISAAILATQPMGWAGAAKPLVESMTPDQRVGVLALTIAVFVQSV